MIAATFWAVTFLVLAIGAGVGAMVTAVINLANDGDPVIWVPMTVVLVLAAAFAGGATGAFGTAAGWS